MRVFVTGATGFIGQIVVEDLKAGGHQVVGLARSDEGAAKLAAQGVEVRRGDLSDPRGLAEAARDADGVVHTAFIHDFSKFMENIEIDRIATEAMLDALAGSGKPFVGSSGTAMIAPTGRPGAEQDAAVAEGPAAGRGLTETLTLAAAERGVRSSVVRLAPSVHDVPRQGLVSRLAEIARATGVSGYVGDGANRWPAVHRLDAARLFRLALERAEPGVRLHAVAEEGVPLKAIAEAVGESVGVPARSLAPEAAGEQFGWLAMFVMADTAASSAATQETFGWRPAHPGLLAGIRQGGYQL
ncbi:MAG TPA: SDR family oxidoreductase [Caulobacteraceae bacterium]|nr:SDR family oxidoreductase [Caulobacteraceae bacterium]